MHIEFGTQVGGTPWRLALDDLRFGVELIGPPGRGKTREGLSVCDQVAVKAPRVGQLIFDGKGDFFQLARRKWYARGMARRLVIIDPNQDDFVTGVNFTAPWPGEEDRQAGMIADLFIRVAEADPAIVVRMRRWTADTFAWLLRAGLTVSDASLLLDYTDSQAREAVLAHMPHSPARSDLEWLCRQVAQARTTSTASKLVDDHLGSTAHRFRGLSENPRLRRMLGTCRAVNVGRLLADGYLILVNLARVAISPTEQRLLLLALLNESLRVMHGMGESSGLRVLITIDEAGLARGPELEELLVRGRSFGFGLQLLHQTCDQFRDPATRDPRVLEAVLSSCRTKGAFGGLSHDDATKIAEALWAHHLDPDRKQFVQASPRQLQRVVTVQSLTRGTSKGRALTSQSAHSLAIGESETESTSWGSAQGYSIGESTVSGGGSGFGSMSGTSAGESMARDAALQLTGTVSTSSIEAASSLDSQFSAQGNNQAETNVDIEGESVATTTSRVEAHTVGKGAAISGGTHEAVAEGPMVVPTDVFYEPTYQIEPLETQLARHRSALVRQPDRTLTVAFDTGRPCIVRTLDFPDPKITDQQARELDRRRVAEEPYYALPADVDSEITQRHAKLLREPSEAVVVDDESLSFGELERNLADAGVPAQRRRGRTKRTKSKSEGR